MDVGIFHVPTDQCHRIGNGTCGRESAKRARTSYGDGTYNGAGSAARSSCGRAMLQRLRGIRFMKME